VIAALLQPPLLGKKRTDKGVGMGFYFKNDRDLRGGAAALFAGRRVRPAAFGAQGGGGGFMND